MYVLDLSVPDYVDDQSCGILAASSLAWWDQTVSVSGSGETRVYISIVPAQGADTSVGTWQSQRSHLHSVVCDAAMSLMIIHKS